jgi:hypothetical protein
MAKEPEGKRVGGFKKFILRGTKIPKAAHRCQDCTSQVEPVPDEEGLEALAKRDAR